MNDRSNVDIVKEAYAAFARGDLAELLRSVGHGVEWEHPGSASIPWAGSFRGHEGVTRFFAALGAEVEVLTFAPSTFFAQGDQVVVLGYERMRARRTGRSYESQWAHAFTFTEGKIVRFREYTDTHAVASACSGPSTD